ncbi:hypothetical protein WJX72_009096 [[Myrmecia] bisecta]|uniref:Glyoxalase/fosfomycin resistance/dioxygenase domain-containing protein n=1 Tax=[Myrmecia] bisecta TaxID=41462 RepID=A0AAW1P691_9CHLO
MATAQAAPPSIYPCLYYMDAVAAIQWLSRVFGFETTMQVKGDDESVHAEMRYGNGGIMLGTAKGPWASPLDLPKKHACIYIYVGDAMALEAHYKHTVSQGAKLERELQDTFYGSKEYSAYDLEGNSWSFGTYLPSDAPAGDTAAA